MTSLRAILYNFGFVLWTLVLGVLGLPALVMSRRAVVRLSRIWTRGNFWWLKHTVGLTYEIRGSELIPQSPAIWALKHQSAWDTMLLNQLLPDPAIVYKRELIWLPIIGWYIWAVGMIPVDRKGGASALRRMISTARRAIDGGRPVAIFPEGTRGPVGGKLPYQPGVGALYTQLGVPLVPVALNSGIYWGKRAFMKRPGVIVVQILPAIQPGLNRRAALELLEQRIETAMDFLLAETICTPVNNFVDEFTSGNMSLPSALDINRQTKSHEAPGR